MALQNLIGMRLFLTALTILLFQPAHADAALLASPRAAEDFLPQTTRLAPVSPVIRGTVHRSTASASPVVYGIIMTYTPPSLSTSRPKPAPRTSTLPAAAAPPPRFTPVPPEPMRPVPPMPIPNVSKDDQTEAGLSCPFPDGRCHKRLHNPIPDRIDVKKVAGQTANEEHGSCRLLTAAKSRVRRVYGNRPNSHGQCGQGVGESILAAGFSFAHGGRNAINYMHLLPEYGWKRLNVSSASAAPPGSVLVFYGPCTPGYRAPGGDHRCVMNGDRLGHVTIKGDDGYYYTDGRTRAPAIAHRYLAGVFVPPGTDGERCGR